MQRPQQSMAARRVHALRIFCLTRCGGSAEAASPARKENDGRLLPRSNVRARAGAHQLQSHGAATHFKFEIRPAQGSFLLKQVLTESSAAYQVACSARRPPITLQLIALSPSASWRYDVSAICTAAGLAACRGMCPGALNKATALCTPAAPPKGPARPAQVLQACAARLDGGLFEYIARSGRCPEALVLRTVCRCALRSCARARTGTCDCCA